MSILTKIFIVLSLLVSVGYLVIAGGLVAKQENFKHRYTAEQVERQRDIWLQERLRNRLGATQEAKRRDILSLREKNLLWNEAAIRAKAANQNAERSESSVTTAIERFSTVTQEFQDIADSYKSTLDGLISKTRDLAKRRNELTEQKSKLWVHLAQAQAEVARLREHLNVLDYKLYQVRQSNEEKRELISSYASIDPALSNPGFGSGSGRNIKGGFQVIAVDPEFNVAVVNCGADVAVQKNMIFTVTRGGQYCGQIEITEVYPNRSAGRILARTLQQPIQPGDQIKPRAVYGAAVGH